MSPDRTIDADGFRKALAAMVADIRVFTLEVDAVGPRHGSVAWEDSPAMKELADEPAYQERCSWVGPITDTHMLGGLTLRAAADYVRTFSESFTTESVPMYGHLVVARAALEASVVSWWLSEHAIARDERVKRGLSEVSVQRQRSVPVEDSGRRCRAGQGMDSPRDGTRLGCHRPRREAVEAPQSGDPAR
jgi:hypothetical protein